jgi:hypothetical protein
MVQQEKDQHGSKQESIVFCADCIRKIEKVSGLSVVKEICKIGKGSIDR